MNIIIEVSEWLGDNIDNIFVCIKYAVFAYNLHQKKRKQKKSDDDENQQTSQKE